MSYTEERNRLRRINQSLPLDFERPYPPQSGNANIIVWCDKVKPNLTARESAVYEALCGYFAANEHQDVTGGELAAWAGLSILSVRPRLTGLYDKGLIRRTDSVRASRAAGESSSHAYYLPVQS